MQSTAQAHPTQTFFNIILQKMYLSLSGSEGWNGKFGLRVDWSLRLSWDTRPGHQNITFCFMFLMLFTWILWCVDIFTYISSSKSNSQTLLRCRKVLWRLLHFAPITSQCDVHWTRSIWPNKPEGTIVGRSPVTVAGSLMTSCDAGGPRSRGQTRGYTTSQIWATQPVLRSVRARCTHVRTFGSFDLHSG